MDALVEQVLELFDRLRRAGFPLGVDQYLLLLRALRLGFGQPGTEPLRRLCRVIWVESQEDMPLFNYHFDAVMIAPLAVATAPAPHPSAEEEAAVPHQTGIATSPDSPEEATLSQETTIPGLSPTEGAELAQRTDDPIATAHMIRQLTSQTEEPVQQRYLLGADYLPVTRRQMKQSWRYLRRMVRVGPATELDIPATLRQVSRDGFLFAPTLRPRRLNQASLLLLLDQNGSMVPFHSLARRLEETARSSGRLDQAEVYYFHNCPSARLDPHTLPGPTLYHEHNLYRKPQCVDARPLSAILAELNRPQTSVLIFSDAGAARGGWSEERIEQTARFLYQLTQSGIERIAWLNPLPRARWEEQQNSATDIASFVPMFSTDRQGLSEAINLLRGRSSRRVTL